MKALEQQLAEAESAATDKENAHAKALQDKAEEHARVVEEQTLAHASSMEEQAQALQEGQTRTQTLQEELDALRAASEEAEKQHNKDASGAALRIQELEQALDEAHAALNALEEKNLQAVAAQEDKHRTQVEQLAKEHEVSVNEAKRQVPDETAKELKQLQFRNKITNDALKGSQEQTKDIEIQLPHFSVKCT